MLGSFLGGICGALLIAWLSGLGQYPASFAALRESDLSANGSGYKFIDPLIGLTGTNASDSYDAMQQDVQTYIAAQKSRGLITATVDFRDIKATGGFALNPDELYTPASLNKVPVMMAYYKIAEAHPSILSDTLTYAGATNSNSVEEITSVEQLTPGAQYTVEELIGRMIKYSDNNAADLLTKHLTDTGHDADYVSVFTDLGLSTSAVTTYSDTVTAQQYAIFLRVLYNATYLNREFSERAMELLSETDFSEGIEAGVPNNISVAQKFGEVRMVDSTGALVGKQINNCGIVYYPSHPYVLCVMTKGAGDDVEGLETVIAGISHIVYTNMQKLYP